MAVKTRAQINSDADDDLPNNSVRAIGAADVRNIVKDLADSAFNRSTDTIAFFDSDYISAEQIAFIRDYDYDSQDASTVTSGLRDMHAAMLQVIADAGMSSELSVVGHYAGGYAVNDELFTEATAQQIWDAPNAQHRVVLVGDRATFHCKGWPSHKAVRTSGHYADRSITDPVPMALFRWEQKNNRGLGPMILGNIRLEGEEKDTDPIGFKGRSLNTLITENLEIFRFHNIGKFLETVQNSREFAPAMRRNGYQPTMASGDGLLSSSVRAATVNNNDGTSTITATESIFTSDHVGIWLIVADAGPSSSAFSGKITTVTSGTEVVVDKECTSDVTDKNLSLENLLGSISADSDSLTLDIEITTDLVGRYVMVHKAGSKLHTQHDLLVTRVTAQSGTTLTLATSARDTVSSVPVWVAPSKYVGKSDDMVDSGGSALAGNNNDYQVFGELIEFAFSADRGTALPAVYQNCLAHDVVSSKAHATTTSFNNFGAGVGILVIDNCKFLTLPTYQIVHGDFSPDYGKIIITGKRTDLMMRDISPIGTRGMDRQAVIYLDPQDASDADCKVGLSAFLNPLNSWPLTDQTFLRFGANGQASQVYGLGPITVRGVSGFGESIRLPAKVIPTTLLDELQVPAGSSATPGLQVGDTGTGLSQSGSGHLDFSIDSGTRTMRLGTTILGVGQSGGTYSITHGHDADQWVTIAGGIFGSLGAQVRVFGPSHGSQPSRILFLDGTTEVARLDPTTGLSINGANQVIDLNQHFYPRIYAFASLPSASPAGQMVLVSDRNHRPVTSDGSDWRFADGTVAS